MKIRSIVKHSNIFKPLGRVLHRCIVRKFHIMFLVFSKKAPPIWLKAAYHFVKLLFTKFFFILSKPF